MDTFQVIHMHAQIIKTFPLVKFANDTPTMQL